MADERKILSMPIPQKAGRVRMMAPKPTLGRTVAIGAVLGLAGCAVLLGSNDGAMRRSLAATPSTPKSVRQETKADRSLRYNTPSAASSINMSYRAKTKERRFG